MPSLQGIDLGRDKPDPTGVQDFFSNLSKVYKEKEENSEIGRILDQYNKNRENKYAWENTNQEIEKSNKISPSRRLQLKKDLLEEKKLLIEEDKSLNTQYKDAKKAQDEQRESEAILLSSGYEPEQARQLSYSLSPASAREILKNQPGAKYNELREKGIAEYVTNTINAGQDAEDQKFAIEESRKAIRGDITGPGYKALLKENPYSQLIIGLTPDEALLQASNKKLLEGSKGLFGPKPTEREIFLLLNSMLPSIGKTKEANEAGLDFIEKLADMKLMKADIVNELTDGGSKYVPNIEQKVNERMKPLVEAFKTELEEADNKYNTPENNTENKGAIKVTAPDGTLWYMTQQQIDAARKQGVNFDPVK